MADTYYVALDLGTNSVILLTTRRDETGEFNTVDEQVRVPRLGEGVGRNGSLTPEAIDRTLEAVAELLTTVEKTTGSGYAVAAATSAVRDSTNREFFLQRFYERFGCRPHVISGEDEARTTFLGATSDQPDNAEILSLDIGGGSTDCGIGRKGYCHYAASLPIGCINLTERFSLQKATTKQQLAHAYAFAREKLRPVTEHLHRTSSAAPSVVATGGTASTYAAMKIRSTSREPHKIHGTKSCRSAVTDTVDGLCGMDIHERHAGAGVPEERAPILPAGLIILDAALEAAGADKFCISSRGLRFGLIVRMHRGDLNPTWHW